VVTAGAAVAGLAGLSGCGSGDGSGAHAAPGTTGAGSAAYPMSLTRTGGVVGFADALVIGADGTVTGSSRAGAVSCRLTAATAQALSTPLAEVPTSGTGPTTGPDAVVVTVSAGGRTLVLGGAAGPDDFTRAVSALLADVERPAAHRTVCR